MSSSFCRSFLGIAFASWVFGSVGAWADSPEIPIKPLPGARADAAALLFSGSEGGALWLATAALPGDSGVDLAVEVDGPTLLAAYESPPDRVRLEAYVYALVDGKLVDSYAGRLSIPTAELDGISGVRWSVRLGLDTTGSVGDYDLRILVRDKGSQTFGLRRLALRPSTQAQPLRFPTAGDWLQARPSATERSGGPDFSPWPVLVLGRPEAVTVPAELGEMRLLDAEGHAVDGCRIRAVGPGLEAKGGVDCAGSYQLAPASGGWQLPILLLPSEWRDRRLTWAQVRRLLESPGDQQRILEAGQEKRRSGRVRAWLSAYAQVLELLAQGRSGDAVAALADFDSQAFESGKTSLAVLEDVKAMTRRLGKELAGEAPESLFPVLWLHLELHDSYVERGIEDSFVYEATWVRIRELVETYAAKADQEMSRRLASTLLAELGIAVDRRGLPRTALRLFQESTEIDPANLEVWRYLAFWHERRGQVDKAVEALGKLLDLAPDLHEARLRRAIGLRRLGQEDQALALLEDVLYRARDRRALTVAYQEAGRLLFRLQRLDEAADRLSAGVERFPENQRLRIQLAHVLERLPERDAERRDRISRLLDELPSDSGTSARHEYQKPPPQASTRARVELTRHANARLPILSTALPALRAAGEDR